MSKGLEALQDIRLRLFIESEVQSKKVVKDLKIIEKELKVLEIAKKHKLFNPFKNAILREMYNLSDKEWEFIQEVFYEIRS